MDGWMVCGTGQSDDDDARQCSVFSNLTMNLNVCVCVFQEHNSSSTCLQLLNEVSVLRWLTDNHRLNLLTSRIGAAFWVF